MKKTVLLLLCCGLLLFPAGAQSRSADGDPAFAVYLKEVKDVDMPAAAKAFIRYLQAAVRTNKTMLAAHVGYPLGDVPDRVAFTRRVNAIVTAEVAQCVRSHDLKADVVVRNAVEYMVGDGCIWFTFQDDNVLKPRIFAITR